MPACTRSLPPLYAAPEVWAASEAQWMAAALAFARRAAGTTGPNPNVGALLLQEGKVVGRGVTAPGGRPHAEAAALAKAGAAARGATLYTTLEPCAHRSPRGPACADLLIEAGVGRVVAALRDPDPRTAGRGFARLRAAGIPVREGVLENEVAAELAGFRGRLRGRPELTMKLAMSLDGRMVTAAGESQWITGEVARHYVHLLRRRADMVVTGRGTLIADKPQLTVRLPGLADHPLRGILTHTKEALPEGFLGFSTLAEMDREAVRLGVMRILAEPGPTLAASLLDAGRVDRLLILRAPILVGAGRGLEGCMPAPLAERHGRWTRAGGRLLGKDMLELYLPADPS